jgi:hypothetical protein
LSIQTPQACWEDYKRKTLPRDAPPVQVVETRRAFMAGMVAMDQIVTEIAEMPDDQNVAALAKVKEALFRIALAYAAQVQMKANR